MKVVIEIENSKDWKVLQDSLYLLNVTRKSKNPIPSVVQRGNKKLNPESLFGVWENRQVDLKTLRSKIWNRKN